MANDEVIIYRSPSKNERMVVDLDGYQRVYDYADVAQIRLSAEAGDDVVVTREKYAPITTRVSLMGGAGDDVLVGGSGSDTLYGEAGDDSLYGGGDRDWLYGGDGRDRLAGGGAYDILRGGAGPDTFLSAHPKELYDVEDEDTVR